MYQKVDKFNYGRFDWKLPYPKNTEEIRSAEDEQIIKWWRFLPPAKSKENSYILNNIVYEFNKRFKYNIVKNV